MPWIFNPNRHAEAIVKANGEHGAIPGKKRVYIDPSLMSSAIGAKIRAGRLLNKGGDPMAPAPIVSKTSAPVLAQVIENPRDTSSDHHEIPVMVDAPEAETAFVLVDKTDDAVDEMPTESTEEIVNDGEPYKPKRRRRRH